MSDHDNTPPPDQVIASQHSTTFSVNRSKILTQDNTGITNGCDGFAQMLTTCIEVFPVSQNRATQFKVSSTLTTAV